MPKTSTKTSEDKLISRAMRLIAAKRKSHGPAPRIKYECLDCGERFSASQVRHHRCAGKNNGKA